MFTTILVQPLFNILFSIYALIPGHDFGIAIIILTLLIRLLLWPLVTHQLHSQRVMQQLQPEVARVRKQAGGDRQKETEMLMELYKEKGTSPFAPLLPILIQLPLLIAFYAVLRDSVQPAQISRLAYPFVEHLAAVAHIIQHHSAFKPTLLGLIDLTKPSVIVAVVAAAAQFYQAKQLQPQTMAAAGDQAKLMSSMTFLFPVITLVVGLRLPSALALYWAVTSLAAAFQQYWVLLRDAHELEAVDEAGLAAGKAGAAALTAQSSATTPTPTGKSAGKRKQSRAARRAAKGGTR